MKTYIITFLLVVGLLGLSSCKTPPSTGNNRSGNNSGEGDYNHKWGFENSPIGKTFSAAGNTLTYFFNYEVSKIPVDEIKIKKEEE